MTRPADTRYQERLTAGWWWWLLTVLLGAGLAVPLAVGLPVPARVPVAAVLVLVPLTGLWWLGRVRVAVVGDELVVDDARLPLRYVSDVIPLDPADRRELLGAGADPLAFVVQRPWVPGAVQIVLCDPADPTPYWLVSSAHPELLAEAAGIPAREPSPTGAVGEAPAPD